jgi:transcriptional regulator with XRE-family HTH domain
MTQDELRSIRVEMGLTQAELADRLEIAKNTICRYEIGDLEITKLVELAVNCLLMIDRKARGCSRPTRMEIEARKR